MHHHHRDRHVATFRGLDTGGLDTGARIGDRLVAVDIEGTGAHVAREDVEALVATVPSEELRCLPGHDQWVIGPGTRDAHVTPASIRDAMTRKANPVIHGGVVRGTWVRREHQLVVTWYSDRRPTDSSIEREVRRMSNTLDHDLELRVAPANTETLPPGPTGRA